VPNPPISAELKCHDDDDRWQAYPAREGDGEKMGNAKRAHAPRLELRALGKFSVSVGDKPVAGLDGRRAQELLTYLVLNRERVFAREALAETLWAEGCGDTRKTLRQVLWQVQSAVAAAVDTPVLKTDNGFIGLHPDTCVHADVIVIEVAHQQAHAARAGPLDDTVVAALHEAASNYRGDLLQNCYSGWCLVERERFRAMYLAILEKLMVNAEAAGNLSDGLWYGEQVLRHDRASERTHRRLMALRYLSGDRTGAMRQYESCARALAEELEVSPGPATRELEGIIRRGLALPPAGRGAEPAAAAGIAEPLQMLRDIHTTLRHACDQLASALTALDDTTTRRP
jgi:DNA-binding SARP family transcriptional activator